MRRSMATSDGMGSMPPLYARDLSLAVVLVVSLLIWRVMETTVDIRSRLRLRAGAQREDRGSLLVVAILVTLGAFLGAVVAFKVPGAVITTSVVGRETLFWLGILLIYAGMAFRLYAIHTLGAYFTTTVAVAPEQVVVETGPYRLIRHPAYTGLLTTLFGFGLTCTNWLTLLIVMPCALIAIGYRIRVEERALRERLGQPYRAYMRRTKRLIPFVL